MKALLTILLFLYSFAIYAAPYYNFQSGVESPSLPNPMGATWNPTPTQQHAAGWREIVEIKEPTPGFRVVRYGYEEIDQATCRKIVLEEKNIADEAAEQEAARIASITPQLWQQAGAFRFTIRKHFGDGAETNRTVTLAAVETYFVGKQMAGSITAQETADALVLEHLFTVISDWTGDGTTFSFPWTHLP